MSNFNPDDDEYDEYEQDYDRREKLITSLSNRLLDIENKEVHEEELREKSPALQDAWDQYQTVLRLAQNK